MAAIATRDSLRCLGLLAFLSASCLASALSPSPNSPKELFSSWAEPATAEPVIGILSQPGDAFASDNHPFRRPGCQKPLIMGQGDKSGAEQLEPPSHALNQSFISASYVKMVEAGGARVVPLLFDQPWAHTLKKLKALNGLLLPGGIAPKKGRFLSTFRRLVKAAMEFNDAGHYFPIWAECLSLEMFVMITSKAGKGALATFNATTPSTLRFVGPWVKERSMFAWMPSALVDLLEQRNLTMENHKYGLSTERFEVDPELSAFFQPLTTTTDDLGKEYISTMEAKSYPFTVIQWHPEKNAFEWSNPLYPHSAHAVQVTTSAALFFVNEARKSLHKFQTRVQLYNNLIFNHAPIFTGKSGAFYEQAYIFYCRNSSDLDCTFRPQPEPELEPCPPEDD